MLGFDHPDTLGSMNNLARVYSPKVTGRGGDAARASAGDSKAVLGFEHPSTLSSMNNLATVYQAQRKLAEAATLHAQVLEIQKRVLGEEHPKPFQ